MIYLLFILSHWSTEKIVLIGQKDALSIDKLNLSHSKCSTLLIEVLAFIKLSKSPLFGTV